MDKRIVTFAKAVRKACENAGNKGIINVRKDLCGACAIASYALYFKLKKEGYKPQFILGLYDNILPIFGQHCWVKLSGNYIDVTATQFDLPKIYISKDVLYKERFYDKFAFNILRSWNNQSPLIYTYSWYDDKLKIGLKK